MGLENLIPEFIILGFASIILTLDFMLKTGKKHIIPVITLIGLIAALAASFITLGNGGDAFNGFFKADGFTDLFRIVILGVGALVVIASMTSFKNSLHEGEYYTLFMFSLAGALIIAGAGELITLYLAIELLSIPAYALVAFRKNSDKANEAVLKYFILGILASAIILYAMSLLYGVTGETQLTAIAGAMTGDLAGSPIVIVAALMFIAGLGFKISAVPFHWWAPDAYEGAPAQISGFLASISKIAAFAALARIFFEPLLNTSINWEVWFGVIAAITMVVGTLLALPQTNIKRLLAYSSITHAGYILMGFAAASVLGAESLLFYLVAYAVATAGAFFVLVAASTKVEAEEVSDLAGLAQRHPGLALVMVILVFSLVGIPPLAGFIAKVYLFGAVIDAGMIWLAVIGVLATVASVGYYLRVVREMYIVEPTVEGHNFTPTLKIASYTALVATIAIGIFSAPIYDLAKSAASALGLGSA